MAYRLFGEQVTTLRLPIRLPDPGRFDKPAARRQLFDELVHEWQQHHPARKAVSDCFDTHEIHHCVRLKPD
jgi:hypothetical protein